MKEIYQVLSAAIGQEQRIAQVSNNLSNINTVGFKRDDAMFTKVFSHALNAASGEPEGTPENPAARIYPALFHGYTDYGQGQLNPTGRGLDVAISGDGFFSVEVEGIETPLYTRAGNFQINKDGELTTTDGRRVLDRGGRAIDVDLQAGPVQIMGDGTVMAGEQEAGRLDVVRFENPQLLQKYGSSLFQAPEGLEPERVDEPELRSATLEGANVNAVAEMVEMIQIQQAYSASQKAMQSIDEVIGKRIQSVLDK